MASITKTKILPTSSNFNSPANRKGVLPLLDTQSQLGLAVARPNLLKGGLTHISEPVRRILARVSTKMRL
jgi:hypothetical protein